MSEHIKPFTGRWQLPSDPELPTNKILLCLQRICAYHESMLVNCPKCGFSQPQDRYCANCGVDMDNFKPAGTPLWKKILLNPFLHVGFIFALVFIAIMMIRQRHHDELRARVEYLKGGPVLVERSQSKTALGEVTAESSTALPPESAAAFGEGETTPPAANTESTPTASAETAARLASPTTTTPAPPPGNKTQPNRVVVIYAEIDRSLLNTWANEMRTAGQLRSFDDVTMGTLPQIMQKLKNSGVKIVQQLEISLANPSSPYEWFVGTHRGSDPDNEIGFFSSLSLADSKDGLIRGELEVQRAFRDAATKTMERVSYGGPFEIVMGTGFVMRGLLPRKFATNLDDDANSDPFLSIFKSRSFLGEETEFTLILDFDTSGPQVK